MVEYTGNGAITIVHDTLNRVPLVILEAHSLHFSIGGNAQLHLRTDFDAFQFQGFLVQMATLFTSELLEADIHQLQHHIILLFFCIRRICLTVRRSSSAIGGSSFINRCRNVHLIQQIFQINHGTFGQSLINLQQNISGFLRNISLLFFRLNDRGNDQTVIHLLESLIIVLDLLLQLRRKIRSVQHFLGNLQFNCNHRRGFLIGDAGNHTIASSKDGAA